MVLGGGFRGTIDQLDLDTKERVRQANLQFIQTHKVHDLAFDVWYAKSQKQADL